MPSWIDVHTHINMLETTPDESVAQAVRAGVDRMITIGTCPLDWPQVLDLAKRYSENVYCTMGVHPHDAHLFDEAAEKQLRDNLSYERLVAIGEIGLDYYYDNAPRAEQRQTFERQMEIAAETNLPVEIHTRDAEEETAEILRHYRGRVRGLLHCFTSSWELAQTALDVGFHISISGVVTFKNATALRDVVAKLPLDRIHVETDAPFLAPVPYRGQKNQPAWVVNVAEAVASLKQISVEELSTHTRRNALDLFGRMTEV